MKKITLFSIVTLSLTLASCSKEQIQSEQESGRTFSMTLNASVNETKATMSDAWKFAFSTGDKISLTNNQVTAGTYYELTRGSDGNFTGTVTAPSAAATWYAYYPSNNVSLSGQPGTQTGTAAYCALAGKQGNVAAGSKNLNITLSFQTAILVIDNQKGAIDINVKTSDGKWVSGFTAKENNATFDIAKSDTKASLLTATATGIYYVVVPAGVKIAVYDGVAKINETKDAGLTAGKYYNVSVAIYTVTFDLNGITGTAPEMQKVAKDSKVTKPADPTDMVHTFAGWYKTKDATTGALSDLWDFDTDIVTADMTLYAKWTRTLGSIYSNSDIPKAENNTAPDNAWENGDGGKAFIAYSGKTTEVLYFYKKLEPSGAKQLSCRKTENFTKIGDDYVLDYILGGKFYGAITCHMTEGKFTSVTYNGAGTDYEVLSGTYAAPTAN